ncbi:MAG: hypothetical protein HYU99_00835 [Deltaproteobacteria bacterium]|nr:hypothetical protein [Deltaproteobacteria bacterium]
MPELHLNPDQQALLRASLGLSPEAPLDEGEVRRFVEETPKEGLDPEMVRQIEADYRAFRELLQRGEGSFGQPGIGSVLTRSDSSVTRPRRDYTAELGDFIDWLAQKAMREGPAEVRTRYLSEVIRRAIVSFFEYVPPPDEADAAEVGIPEENLHIYNNDTWLELLGNSRLRRNIDPNASIDQLCRRLFGFDRLLHLNAPVLIIRNEVRLTATALRRLLLPEVFIRLEQESLSGLSPRIRQHPLLGKHPVLAKKIARLLEAGLVMNKQRSMTIDMMSFIHTSPGGQEHEMGRPFLWR